MQPPISMALAECVLLNFEWILAMMKYCVPLTCPLIDVIHCLPFRILYYNKILIFFVCLFATVLRSFLLLFIFFATNNPAGCYSTLKEESERVSEAGGLHF